MNTWDSSKQFLQSAYWSGTASKTLVVLPSCDGCELKSWDSSTQAGISAYWEINI